MKIVFMGTPEFAVPTLTEIVSTGHEVGRRLHACAKTGGARAGRAQVAGA